MRSIDSWTTKEEIAELHAAQWQLDLLAMNPEYTCWGNFEDYMSRQGSNWESRCDLSSWKEFGPWELDELNELVNFYFEVYRPSKECGCESGLNPETHALREDWYDLRQTGREWQHQLTEDELAALKEHNRVKPHITLEELNRDRSPLKHDAINCSICVEVRAKRLGVYGHCSKCQGRAYIYTADTARVALQLWFIHPRKGCSRGVYIEQIHEHELGAVIDYLRKGAARNAQRFAKLRPAIKFEATDDPPQQLNPNTVYLCTHLGKAYHQCLCGCGAALEFNIVADNSWQTLPIDGIQKFWGLDHSDGKVTFKPYGTSLSPHMHYSIKDGRVVWV